VPDTFPSDVSRKTIQNVTPRTRPRTDRIDPRNVASQAQVSHGHEIGSYLLNQFWRGEHDGGRAGHGNASRVDARSRAQVGVHAGRIDDQLFRNIHPSPGVDADRRVGEVNQQCHDGSLETSHHPENLVGDQHGLQRAPLDDGLPLQSRQGLEHFVVGRGRDLLRRQIQPLVIVVHWQPRYLPAGETGAGAVVPLERRPLRISRFQVVPVREQRLREHS